MVNVSADIYNRRYDRKCFCGSSIRDLQPGIFAAARDAAAFPFGITLPHARSARPIARGDGGSFVREKYAYPPICRQVPVGGRTIKPAVYLKFFIPAKRAFGG